jgi:geranylgeranyl reductase family protein
VRDGIAVIGAGPAGAWTAFLLARSGARVSLFDPSHPREKPCGGGITGRALTMVADARVELPRLVRVCGARFIDSIRDFSCMVPLDQDRPGLVVGSRRDFDECLVRAACDAGATLVSSRVRSIERNGRGWRIDITNGPASEVEFVVGADGANSIVRRHLARPFRRDQLSIAAGFYAHGATSHEIALEFTSDPPGYIWSFPRPDHLAVGICAQADAGMTSPALRARTARWITTLGVSGARLEPYSWPIPSLSSADLRSVDVSGPGFLLTGDAAGLVDPITREGIFFGLQSAAFAAAAITSGDETSLARRYREAVHDEIIPELARASRLKSAFFRPRFIRLMLDALASSESVRRVMADLLTGAQPYRGLKWRLAGTFELGLAINALRSMRD